MRATLRWFLFAGLALAYSQVQAQIYTCTAPDGSRIFSDEKCGPDAKLVPGITSGRRPTASQPAVSVPPKSPAELEELLKRCNEGDEPSCMAWSKGGGPNQLRSKERELENACEAGSLRDCEQRYCRDGMSDECRHRVLETAALSGATWYLRDQNRPVADGPAMYTVRCLRDGSRELRDVTITCAAIAAPDRCRIGQGERSFPRLDAAAASVCGGGN